MKGVRVLLDEATNKRIIQIDVEEVDPNDELIEDVHRYDPCRGCSGRREVRLGGREEGTEGRREAVSYRITLSKPAVKALRGSHSSVNNRLGADIDALKEDPRPPGCKKLIGREELWRIRVGDYRLIYSVDNTIQVVEIRRIGHRGDIYR